MELTTQQKEEEAAKAAEMDGAAMERLMQETLDQQPPQEPPPEETPPPPEAEKKEEQPPAEKPAEKPPAEAPPQKPDGAKAPEPDEFEKELESQKYELPAGATRQAKEVNKAVKHTAREEHTLRRTAEAARADLEKQLKELQEQVATAKQEREELERLRPIVETFAIERDPNLNARFGTEMAKINHRIMLNLRNNGLAKETAEYIMQHGGPSQFSKDSVSQVEAEPEYKGGPPITMSHKEFWEERVLKQLSEENQRPLKLAFDDELRLKEWRDAELRSRLSNREQYFKNLEEQSKKQEENFKAECKKELDAQLKDLGDIAKEKTIPADATPQLKQRLEGYNRFVRDSTAKFDESFLDTSPKALVKKNLGGLLLDGMRTLLALKDDEIAEERKAREAIQKKWDASLKAANTSHRQSVQQQPKPPEGSQFEKNDGARMEKMMMELP